MKVNVTVELEVQSSLTAKSSQRGEKKEEHGFVEDSYLYEYRMLFLPKTMRSE